MLVAVLGLGHGTKELGDFCARFELVLDRVGGEILRGFDAVQLVGNLYTAIRGIELVDRTCKPLVMQRLP